MGTNQAKPLTHLVQSRPDKLNPPGQIKKARIAQVFGVCNALFSKENLMRGAQKNNSFS